MVWIIGLWPLLSGQASPLWDGDGFFAPYYMLVADHAQAGQLLLWDPWTEAGVPAFADPQVGAFSPLIVGMAFLTGPTLAGYMLCWFVIWLLGGIGMLLLARHLGAPGWGAWSAAVGFGFSGFFFGHAQHLSFIVCCSFLPWIIWRLDVALRQRRLSAAVEAGALWGVSALSGYPGMVVAVAGVTFAWAVGRVLTTDIGCPAPDSTDRETPRASWISALVGLATLAGVGVVVLAPSYAAFATEGRGYSDRREALSREQAITSNTLTPRGLLTFSSPYLAVLQFFNPTSTPTDCSSIGVFVSGPVLWLAVVGLILARGGWRWWILGIAILGVCFALGEALPFRSWLYDFFPPTRYFRHASLFRFYIIFAVAVLAAVGSREIERLRRHPTPTWPAALSISGILLAVAGLVSFQTAIIPMVNPGPEMSLAKLHARFLWVAVALLGVLGAFRDFRAQYLRRFPWFVIAMILVDLSCAIPLTRYTAYIIDPNLTRLWHDLEKHHVSSLDLKETSSLGRKPRHEFGPIVSNKHFLVRIPVILGYPTPLGNRFMERWRQSPALLAAIVGEKRPIWFAPRAALVEPTSETFDSFARRSIAKKSPPMIIHPPPDKSSAPTNSLPPLADAVAVDDAPLAAEVPVELVEYTPNRIAFSASCPSDGWLVFSDRWAAGWKATVDDQAVDVAPGMFVFRAIQVHAGVNSVVFEYRPTGFPYLLILSWGLLGIVLLAAVGRVVGPRFGIRPRPASPAADRLERRPD